jgi:hypothetical protein
VSQTTTGTFSDLALSLQGSAVLVLIYIKGSKESRQFPASPLTTRLRLRLMLFADE